MDMESTKDAISSFGDIRRKIEDLSNIKNNIKTSLLGNIDNIIRFLQVGAGIVSIDLVNRNITNLIGTSKVWIRNKTLVKEITTISSDFKLKFLDDDIHLEETSSNKSENFISKSKIEKEVIDPTPEYTKRIRPTELKLGDVVYLPVGPIQHYCIVKKVTKNTLFVIPITSNTSDFIGYTIEKSRFFHGTAIYSIVQYPTDLALKKFVMPYDNKTELSNIIKGCENYLKENSVISKTYKKNKKK